MEGKFGADGFYWPPDKYPVLQRLANRRYGVSFLFRIMLWLGRAVERRGKK